MTDKPKIAVIGINGRMGRMIAQQIIAQAENCTLSAAISRKGGAAMGHDVGHIIGIDPVGMDITDDATSAFRHADVVIDFTNPETTAENAKLAVAHDTALVIGTTGLSTKQEAELQAAATKVPVVYAPNMSLGVNVLLALVERAAKTLEAFDIEIFEAHHKHKIDAPSGTALALGKAAAQGRNIDFEKHAVYSREGETGARHEGDIGFSVFRGGDVVGEHTVTLAGLGERIELTHKASNRDIFAKGAVHAALWLNGKSAGLYNMQDVLGLHED